MSKSLNELLEKTRYAALRDYGTVVKIEVENNDPIIALITHITEGLGSNFSELIEKGRFSSTMEIRTAVIHLVRFHFPKVSKSRLARILHRDHSLIYHHAERHSNMVYHKDTNYMPVYLKAEALAKEWLGKSKGTK